ncbi:phage tail tape measure protein [Pseudomonas sp.]|uniref:phage tail tape measure protein n=1 Tax=Pseudomonas sp. TaxID=306 RepID=UPI003FD8639D
MSQFDVDFTGSMRQLGEFNLRLSNLGTQLDHMEKAFGTTGSVSKEVFTKMRTSIDEVTTAVQKSGGQTEQLGKKLADAEGLVGAMFQKMAAENAKATLVAQGYNGEMAALGKMLNDTASKNTYSSWQQKTLQLTNKLVGENQFLRNAIAAMDTELGKSNANLKTNLSFKQSLATTEQRLRNTGTTLALTYAGMNTEQGRSNVLTQSYIASKKAQITEEFRLDTQLKTLERTLASLTGGQQEEITKIQQMIAARKAEIVETQREDAELQRLQRTLKSLEGGRQQEITVVRAAIAARKKAITEATSEQKALDELTAAIRREEQQLVRLQVQSRMMSSSHGQKIAQLKQNIQEQERLNKVLSMSTAELLGFTGAQTRANLAMAAGSQSAAMLRAGLQGMQASIGMYTSATILAATATYAISAAMRSAVTTGMEFTATMSRADAIMSTSGASWMQDSGKSFKAMEAQVRALGQSTIFTASQVAEGLSELGMAGLSAGDAIVALKPALSLANIANVSMARSADIATNTMMIFGMEAKDLGDIVDIMATAVNNSNTDIEQLANSLTYAGPAAQTAGISFKDTTAAIEALANSGIKGSRSGSALRRLFVSILNPTKKGAEVIRKYGLDIQDAEGKTRGLVDIIGQLNTKFKDLPGDERLGAIQNLVGVYATSPIAALVDQSDNLARFRRQLDDTANAAEKMEKKIADNLKFDWKSVISSFEEVQLQAFDSVEGRLREASMQMSKYLIELTHPIAQPGETYEQILLRQKVAADAVTAAQKRLNEAKAAGADKGTVNGLEANVRQAQNNYNGGSISELDRILQKATTAAEAIGKMVAGILAFKLATGNVASAFSTDTRKMSVNATELSARANATTAAMRAVAPSISQSSIALQLQSRAAIAASAAWGTLTGAVATASAWMSRAAMVAGGLMRALGWVGLIWGIGSAIASVWNSDTDKDILAQKASVDDVRDSYLQLKDVVAAYAVAKTRAALDLQVEADTESQEKVTARIKERTKLLEQSANAGLPTQALKDELVNLNRLYEDYSRKILAANGELNKMATTEVDVAAARDKQAIANQKALAAREALSAAEKKALDNSRSGMNDLKGQSQVAKLTQELKDAKQAAIDATKHISDVQARLVDLAQAEAMQDTQRDEAGRAAAYQEQLTAAGKLWQAENELIDSRARMAALIDRNAKATEAYNTAVTLGDKAAQDAAANARPGVGVYEQLKNEVDGAAEAFYKLQNATNFKLNLGSAQEALADFYRSDAEKLDKAKKDLAANLGGKDAMTFATPELGMEVETNRLKEELKLRTQIKSLEKKDEKAGKAGESAASKASKDALRDVEQAQRAYDALAKKLDPVTFAQRELAKGTEAMSLLRSKDLITVDQQILATGQLNLAYYKATEALDKNKAALEKVRESYNKSPFLDTAADLAVLQRSLESGKLSLTEYTRLTERLAAVRKESAISGLPEVNTSVGDASSSPFTDWVSTEIERAKGLEAFNKRGIDLGKGEVDALAGLEESFAAKMDALNAQKLVEQGAEEEHNRKMLEIQTKYQSDKKGIIETAAAAQTEVTNKQAQYAEAMSTMALASAMGTVNNVLATFASAADDATAAQKIAFVAQKAIAVAQILMYTEIAAAQAMAVSGNPMVLGIPLANFVRATGYANAALVGSLAIGELAGGGKSSGGGTTTMYDTGGFIPYNRTGIVGEYGPELVSGPMHVTGRGNSASKISGGGNTYEITLAPVIQVSTESSGGGDNKDAEKQAAQLGKTVQGMVVTTLKDQMRPGGALDAWAKNNR